MCLSSRLTRRGICRDPLLGRLRDRRGRADLSGLIEPMAERSFGGVDVREAVLYRSELTPRGPRYEAVAREPL